MAVTSTFAGFSGEAIQFMADLAANNDRAWFQPRKADYERLVKEPMESLMVALAEQLEARRIPLVADPKRSPFRIYRDTRFSRDKSPYKTHIGASLPWVGGADGSMPRPGPAPRATTTARTATARTSTSSRGRCTPAAACGCRPSRGSTPSAGPWSTTLTGCTPPSRTRRSSRSSAASGATRR